MGCTISSNGKFEPAEFDDFWLKEPKTAKNQGREKRINGEHSGWKIVRINLISTFKDFRNERAKIHNLIETELQPLANKSKMFIQLEDFNSGSRCLYEDPESVYLLSHCIQQSSKEHGDPFYIHLLGDCAGFVIDSSFPDDSFLVSNGLRKGLSLNESALILAGTQNTNALFLHRNSSFLQEIPFNVQSFTEDDFGRERAEYFADKIKTNAVPGSFKTYSCRTDGFDDPHHKRIVLVGLEEMIDMVKDHIEMCLCQFRFVGGANYSADQKRKKSKGIPKQLEGIFRKLESATCQPGFIVLTGDGGTGKSSLLEALFDVSKKKGTPRIFVEAEGKDAEQCQRQIVRQIGNEGDDYVNTLSGLDRALIIIDNADQLGKDIQKILVPNPKLTFVISQRKSRVSKNLNPTIFELKGLEKNEAVESMAKWMSPNHDDVTSSNRAKAIRIFERAEKGETPNDENIEKGPASVCWSPLKCDVTGSLVRFGASEAKATQLAQHSTNSVVEGEFSLLESDGRGHLLLATICYLTIIKDGLNEMELRFLLAPEDQILPAGIRRKYRNLPFEYALDKYSQKQVAAIRWRFVIMRIEHYLNVIDKDSNHFVLATVCQRIARKRYLSSEPNDLHFKKRLERLLSKDFVWMKDRSAEIKRHI